MSNFDNYDNYNNNRPGRGGGAVVLISIALVMLLLGALIGVVIYQGVQPGDDVSLDAAQQSATPTPGIDPTALPDPTASPTATPKPEPANTPAYTLPADTMLSAFSDQIADVVEGVQDSVVGIHNYQTVTVSNNNYGSGYSYGGWPFYYYYGGGQQQPDQEQQPPETIEQMAGSGSGVIYSENGYIITNYHVIEGASRVTVLHGGEEIDAAIVGYDEVQDIALLKVEKTGLPAARMGNSDEVRTGEFSIAIGSPLGDELAGTTTFGMVSYAHRTIEIDGALVTMIQTDAAINSGNSGGALMNVQGEVIGINTRKSTGTSGSGAIIEGIGFAIPINDVRATVEQLIATGKIVRPGLGITGKEIAGYYEYVPSGIQVTEVAQDGPAAKAGIQVADIITAIDGQEVASFSALRSVLYSHKIGDTITVTVYRAGQTMDMQVTLGELQQ